MARPVGHGHGMLLGDAHVEDAIGVALAEGGHAGAGRHPRRDGHHAFVLVRDAQQLRGHDSRVVGHLAGGAGALAGGRCRVAIGRGLSADGRQRRRAAAGVPARGSEASALAAVASVRDWAGMGGRAAPWKLTLSASAGW